MRLRILIASALLIAGLSGWAAPVAADHTGQDAECSGIGCTDTWTQSEVPDELPDRRLAMEEDLGSGRLHMHVTDADGDEVYTLRIVEVAGVQVYMESLVTDQADTGTWTMEIETHGQIASDSLYGWVDFQP